MSLSDWSRYQRTCVRSYSSAPVSAAAASGSAVVCGPPLEDDEAERADRVATKLDVPGGAVGIEERDRPPAVVVEEGVEVPPRPGVVGVALPVGVPVPLRTACEVRHGLPVRRCRVGDRDRVQRLEYGKDVPERPEPAAERRIWVRRIPVEVGVPPDLADAVGAVLRDAQ